MENFKGQSEPLFTPNTYRKIYNCLNGKGTSCITTREIIKDKIFCALKKVDDNIDVIKGISSRLENSSINTENEYYLRLKIIDKLSSFGIEYPFEKIEGMFSIGARVKIKKDSKYSHQSSSIGTIGNDFQYGKYFSVEFDNGYSNQYRISDLKVVGSKKNIDKEKTNILASIENEPRNIFIKKIIEYIINIANKDETLLNKLGIYNSEFKIGDNIVMNKEANHRYILSKEGSEGVVFKILNGIIYIKFSSLKGKTSNRGSIEDNIYDIEPEYMINKNQTKTEIGEQEEEIISSFINEIISSSLIISKSDILDLLLEEMFFIKTESGNYVLNHRNMKTFISPELIKVYQNREIYTNQSVLSLPPAESQPHVLMLELTQGCNYNGCTYCDLYKDTTFSSKTFEEFKNHVDEVIQEIGNYKRKIKRIFIGSGNALNTNQDILLKSLGYITENFELDRISIYGNSNAIISKGVNKLNELHNSNLNLIYWGIESGSDKVLKYVNKGSNMKQILKAGEIINNTNIILSVMIIPGLGGINFFDEHIKKNNKSFKFYKYGLYNFYVNGPVRKLKIF